MRILSRLVVALALLLLPAAAQARADQPQTRPALWRVADADTTIYLFGTIHALPKGIDWYKGPVASAFESSGELVTEILSSDPAVMQATLLSRASLPEGQTLRGLLGDKERKAYEAALKSQGMDARALDRFQPWYAAVMLTMMPLMKSGYDAADGVDAQLDARAKALSRTHSALETAEFQFGLFASLPMATQKAYLAEVVKTMPTIRRQLGQMVVQWQRGNAARLAQLMNAEEDDPVLVETLITQRNRTWARWIRRRLDKPGTVFIAVGAGHLAGRGSVRVFLAKSGVEATRLQ
jgi:uncharacterized protein YbaP (TraB family)